MIVIQKKKEEEYNELVDFMSYFSLIEKKKKRQLMLSHDGEWMNEWVDISPFAV